MSNPSSFTNECRTTLQATEAGAHLTISNCFYLPGLLHQNNCLHIDVPPKIYIELLWCCFNVRNSSTYVHNNFLLTSARKKRTAFQLFELFEQNYSYYTNYSSKIIWTIQTKLFEQNYLNYLVQTKLFAQDYSNKTIRTKLFEQNYSNKTIRTKRFEQNYSNKTIRTKLFEQNFSNKTIQRKLFEQKTIRTKRAVLQLYWENTPIIHSWTQKVVKIFDSSCSEKT
jgi:hypothetical protein